MSKESESGARILLKNQDDHNMELMRLFFHSLLDRSYWRMRKSEQFVGISWASSQKLRAFRVSGHIYFANVWLEKTRFSWWHLAILLTLPFGCMILLRLFKRSKKGHCSECGYDLRGNVTGVCSECGTLIFSSVDSESQLDREAGSPLPEENNV
jgi:hypothetical protein